MKYNLTLLKSRVVALLLALLCSTLAHAESFKVTDVRIEGLQRVSASPAFAVLPIMAGDTVDSQSVALSIRELFATGFFEDIKAYRDGGVLIFNVKELPTISEITIDGNKAIKTEMLEDAMSKNDLAVGQIFKRSMLDGILNELERQYIAQGRYSAEVKAEISDLPHNQVKVDVIIDEGKVASIKHINIVGNEVFSDEELISLFELKTSGTFSFITSDDRYAREKLQGDIETLESYYLDRGYLDFNIISSQVSLSPDQKSVYITLNINEGEIYKVKEVDLAGELIFPESRLRRLLLLREGMTYSQALMTATSEYITNLMGEAGYTNAEVKGIPTPNSEDHTVDITFLVNPSQRVYVRRIEFKGNTSTQDEVLRREMRQMEGSPASNSKIEQGKIRLERLGYFREVKVQNNDVPGYTDKIDVEYTVEEQPSASVNASIGYSQSIGMTLGASLQHNNWQGSGKKVGVSINHSEYQTAYNFSYSDPYFTPDGVNRGISLFYNSRDYSKINVTSYTTDSYGMNFTFGYPISEIQGLNYSFGYTHLNVKTGQYTVQEIRRTPFELDLSNNAYLYVTQSELAENGPDSSDGVVEDFSYETGPVDSSMLATTPPGFVDLYGDSFDTLNATASWRRSTLNRGIMATRGTKNSLSLEITIPKSDLEYYIARYEGVFFQPITNDYVLKFRAEVAYGDGYGDMDRLPFFKNFYSGGFGSIRGFDRSSLGPQATPPATYVTQAVDYTAIDGNLDGVNDALVASGSAFLLCEEDITDSFGRSYCDTGRLAQNHSGLQRRSRSFGGNLLVEFGAELIFPIPFVEDQRSMQMAFFVDAGNVFDTQCGSAQLSCSKFDTEEIRASFGLGLNWLSGMGPLTFSYSKPLRSQPGDLTQGFQFSLAAPY